MPIDVANSLHSGSSPQAGRRLRAVRHVVQPGGSSPQAGRRRLAHAGFLFLSGLIPAGGEATGCPRRDRSLCRAHPRRRGGDDWQVVSSKSNQGSSPQAGRRPPRPRELGEVDGLIPAGGEATTNSTPSRSRARAHPRGRGGDLTVSDSPTRTWGSSPRAGRRLDDVETPTGDVGLIPAGGEATRTAGTASRGPGAHPRGRGGDMNLVTDTRSRAGSSPRAGRRRREQRVQRVACGLIPAGGEATRAGTRRWKGSRAHPRGRGGDGFRMAQEIVQGGLIPAGGEATRTPATAASSRRAHPRGRGGDRAARSRTQRGAGSSPRAGRRHRRPFRRGHEDGLIPAGGEATRRPAPRWSGRWAHPRGRGGDPSFIAGAPIVGGSSPRAGRRRGVEHLDRRVRGLIPAGGEATATRPTRREASWAHPRGRGGDAVTVHRLIAPRGSSPRAGRRLRRGGRGRCAHGLIPAGGEATTTRTPIPPGSGAHPRGRGGDPITDAATHRKKGSSPRAGRRRAEQREGGRGVGLIPAGGEATRTTSR